jgi:hypothetical protein
LTTKGFEKKEYIMLNRNELWEIDYSRRSAIEVSEVVQKELLKGQLSEYTGSIEDYLNKEKHCKNIHFHTSISGAPRAHIKDSCTFDV